MIINNKYLEDKVSTTGWVETYKYDTLLEGIQERILPFVIDNSDFIIDFFERCPEGVLPFKEDAFLANMMFSWLYYENSYYREKDRVESYWRSRLSVAGGSGEINNTCFDIHKEREEELLYVVDLLVYITEELEKDSVWKELPTPVKMYYYFCFVATIFNKEAYYNRRSYNWIKSSVYVEPHEGCKIYERESIQRIHMQEIDKASMLKTFYRNSTFSRYPLDCANEVLKREFSGKSIYDLLYIPLFTEIHEYLEENYSLQGLVFDIESSQESKVFDTDSYRKEMASAETNVLNNRFAAERPIKDAENDKQVKGRNKQSRVDNASKSTGLLVLFWIILFLCCLIYHFI